MQCCANTSRRRPIIPEVPTPTNILPFYGPGPITNDFSSDLVLALPFRGESASRLGTFSITSTSDQALYYCYPVEYGLATIADRNNGMLGAWDGAKPGLDTLGPVVLDVMIGGTPVPFYLYRTDFSWNSTTRWRVT